MMKQVLRAAVAAAGLSLAAAGAHAQAYIGLGVGTTKFNDDCSGASTCDTTDTGGKVYAGYKFGSNLSGEVVYLGFGKAKFAGSGITSEVKASALALAVAFTANVTPQVPFVGRLGVARAKANASGRSGTVTFSDSETSTQAYAGFSLGYAFTPSAVAALAYDTTRVKYRGGTDPVSLLSVYIEFSF